MPRSRNVPLMSGERRWRGEGSGGGEWRVVRDQVFAKCELCLDARAFLALVRSLLPSEFPL